MILTVRVPYDPFCIVSKPEFDAQSRTDLEDTRKIHWFGTVIDSKSDEQYADECKQPGQSKPKFQIGELVRLKSGGPLMTIIGGLFPRPSTSYVKTVWFDGKQQSMTVHEDTLQHEPTEAEKQAIENAKRLARIKMDEAIEKSHQQAKANQAINNSLDALDNTEKIANTWPPFVANPLMPSPVRPEQLTTHRENVSNYIDKSFDDNARHVDFRKLKRALLYIVKHVRFQDDKK